MADEAACTTTADEAACTTTDDVLCFETLPSDAARGILEFVDAVTLANFRACSTDAATLVDAIAADLLARHMRELRHRAERRSSFLPRGAEPASFVGFLGGSSLCLIGGMSCGGSARRRSLHGHTISSSFAFKTASYCGRQALLVRSDGALIGDGPGMRGVGVVLDCNCDADVHGCDGAEAEVEAEPAMTAEEEAVIREQEEEAACRGWGYRAREHAACIGCGPPALLLEAKLLALPEAAVAACACPGRSFVLGQSGAVYSARWHGALASRGPSVSPWSCWVPSSPALRVVEISALSAHVLLRTASASAMSFGEPQEGKLGYAAPRAVYVASPRVIEALAGHAIVAVAAGGRHSLFLTERGECFTAGANHAGQCGPIATDAAASAPVRLLHLPADCAPLVQVSAGHAHTLLLSHAGRAYACGLNDRGQCGIEPGDADGAVCVPTPTLIGGLLPHTVRAVEAGPSLSVFEVEEATGAGSAAAVESACADAPLTPSAATALAAGAADEPPNASESEAPFSQGHTLWLAGHVEAFNIPGTNAHAGGLRFLPSCYRWQLASAS